VLLTAQMSRHCRAAAERSEQERESAGAMNSIGNIHTALAEIQMVQIGRGARNALSARYPLNLFLDVLARVGLMSILRLSSTLAI